MEVTLSSVAEKKGNKVVQHILIRSEQMIFSNRLPFCFHLVPIVFYGKMGTLSKLLLPFCDSGESDSSANVLSKQFVILFTYLCVGFFRLAVLAHVTNNNVHKVMESWQFPAITIPTWQAITDHKQQLSK
jgi:hypothetical protein